jgi:hypothetical protein
MTLLQAGKTYSDLDQSLLVVGVFLAVLTILLIGAAYLEPRSKAKPMISRGSRRTPERSDRA